MQVLIAIVTLLQFATSFLATSLDTPMQPQAEQFAEQVIQVAQETLLQAQSELEAVTTMEEPIKEPEAIIGSGITALADPVDTGIGATTKEDKPKEAYTLHIIDDWNGKGIKDRKITTSNEIDGRQVSNEVYLGLVIFNQDKTENRLVVEVTSDLQPESNKSINGTGNITKINLPGERKEVNVYPYVYTATKAGTHTITFTTEGLTKSISFEVEEQE